AMQESPRDLAALVVPQVGRVVATDDPWEPWRLVDGDGVVVEPVAAYLRDLHAAGRSAATARSYGMGLLRWFRPVDCTPRKWGCRSPGHRRPRRDTAPSPAGR